MTVQEFYTKLTHNVNNCIIPRGTKFEIHDKQGNLLQIIVVNTDMILPSDKEAFGPDDIKLSDLLMNEDEFCLKRAS